MTPREPRRRTRTRATRKATPATRERRDALWFKTAVFYEIHVRGFFDANDDGSGDLRGLIQRVDYLPFLGVDCICLLPVQASPSRDGGYDVSDFVSVQRDYGTVSQLQELVDAAHGNGIRVVLDVPISHTSSDHPWFQEARSSPDSPKRDWFVWSGAEEHRHGEPSSWTWDQSAEAYYRHRFFHHEPALNFDNPEVREAMLNVLRFWLDLGVDGFRLIGVSYLFEHDDGDSENLPETHEFLRRARAAIDAEYPNRVLLVEPNEWPEDVASYFGTGDECHLAFHFPLMSRMFMALRREDATPVYELLERTPPIPETCAWALVLRNHDELTLKMVTDEERDYMYAEYAKDPRMKANLGVRRRLAPLLDNGRDEMELMHAVLLSLPGSPFLYYGDEIGMGDNVSFGPRTGVRTPMQWTGDRNAGFSRADWAQLYLQPLMDPVYGYQAVNVEAQLRTPTSLLSWLSRLIALRKEHPVLGLGSFEALASDNRRIFAHIRRLEDEIVLCVHNFARTAEPVQLDLARFAGMVPEEMSGPTRFPAIGELPYLLTLEPCGFFWFRLCRA
jgi:maltose alpha-D-glucosyltransferase/alpha-amylase